MLVFLVVTWIRWSFVRIRADQILAISWKFLLPATLLLLMATAVVVALQGSARWLGGSARASGATSSACASRCRGR